MFSFSSRGDCDVRREPNMLEGREIFCRVRGLGLGEDGIPKLLWEWVRSKTGLTGLEGLDDLDGEKKDAARPFFLSILGGALSGLVSMRGVRPLRVGLKMLKLLRLRFSDMLGDVGGLNYGLLYQVGISCSCNRSVLNL